jgi:hypothetical protein
MGIGDTDCDEKHATDCEDLHLIGGTCLGFSFNLRILLANPFKVLGVLFLGKFPQLSAFQEGWLDTPIPLRGGWPTVSLRFLIASQPIIHKGDSSRVQNFSDS